MNTAIEIETPTQKIIIDAKYYRSAFTRYHEKKSYISNNIYQIKAYMEAQKPIDKQIKGMLLYPSNPYEFDDQFLDRKSTRLNSSHVAISYAVFCLKKK